MAKLEPEDVFDALNEALARFGPYTYYDKGPEEVMDVAALEDGLLGLDARDAAALLGALWEHQHGHILAGRLLASQETREDFTAVLAACPEELREDYEQESVPHSQPEPFAIPVETALGMLARDGRLASGG